MARKRLLYLTSNDCSVYIWKRGSLTLEQTYPATADGVSEFAAAIAREPDIATSLLVDMVEEEFRSETMPHIMGRDRNIVLDRKLGQLYRRTPYRIAQIQGREKKGRRDDRVLLTALTNPEFVQLWLRPMQEHRVPLSGIFSMSHLGERLSRMLRLPGANSLVMTLQHGRLLRQSFMQDGKIKISRLAPLPEGDFITRPGVLADEVVKHQRYLNRLQLLPFGATLDVHVLCDAEMRAVLKEQCTDTKDLRYHLHDVGKAAGRLGLKQSPSADHCEMLYLYLLGASAGPANYAQDDERRYFLLHQTRYKIMAASVLLALGSVLFSVLNWHDSNAMQDRVSAMARDMERIDREYQSVLATLPKTPVRAQDMRNAVELSRELSRGQDMPERVLVALSRGLDRHPRIQVEEVNWVAAVAEQEAAEDGQESSTGPAGLVVTLRGRLVPFGKDYRDAFAQIESFMLTLRQQQDVISVNAQSMPLDVGTEAMLNGEVGVNRQITEAYFEIRAIMGSKRDAT